jgi:hypothetical protein
MCNSIPELAVLKCASVSSHVYKMNVVDLTSYRGPHEAGITMDTLYVV